MNASIPAPLEKLDSNELFRMLGEAWCAQVKPEPGRALYLPALSEIGRFEYQALSPWLRIELEQTSRSDVVAVAAAAIKRHGNWRMPASIIAALAQKDGLV